MPGQRPGPRRRSRREGRASSAPGGAGRLDGVEKVHGVEKVLTTDSSCSSCYLVVTGTSWLPEGWEASTERSLNGSRAGDALESMSGWRLT
jgi:hypothetical protein